MRTIPSAAQPTFHGYVASTQDCLVLFEACRVGALKRIQRRLTEQEREKCIKSGSVFVWEEGESGIKRWTDSKSWSPSRIKGSFLVYREVDEATARRRASSVTSDDEPSSPNTANLDQDKRRKYSSDSGKGNQKPSQLLTKKSISVRTKEGGKLHVVCYYTKSDVAAGRLLTPRQDPNLSQLAVRVGLYPDIIPEVSTLGPAAQNTPPMEVGSNTQTSPTVTDQRARIPSHRSIPPPPSTYTPRLDEPRTPDAIYAISAAKSQEYPYQMSPTRRNEYPFPIVPDGGLRHHSVEGPITAPNVSAYPRYPRRAIEYRDTPTGSQRNYRLHPYQRPNSNLSGYTSPRATHDVPDHLFAHGEREVYGDRVDQYLTQQQPWTASSPQRPQQQQQQQQQQQAPGPRLPPLRMALSRADEEGRWRGY
ncbi:hypothetical protein SpCBS45565_g04388 [Spizellomyces sp. 'palustris']|nr:hypothetical protein SpCBS45565_g04388 [Spizellomyces sp. 'palustris']